MGTRKKKKSIWSRLTRRYQFNVMNQENYEVKSVLNLSILNISLWSMIVVLLLSGLIYACIAYTPLKHYIPGYGKSDVRQTTLKHQLLADSLLVKFEQNNAKLEILEKVLRGDIDTAMDAVDLFAGNYDSLLIYSESKEDSILRAEVELRERFSIFDDEEDQFGSIKDFTFYPPIKGVFSDSFHYDEKHFGVDIVAGQSKDVKSVLDGVVIFSEFTIESGYIIGIYHAGNLISVYKHNSKVNYKIGDEVLAGEVIAEVGNTGELSSGPHLHFELWYDGQAIDPTKYINFD